MENRNWIIIDKVKNSALYGVGRKTLRFSTMEIAFEVAIQFFESQDDYLVFNIDDIVT